MTTKSPTLAQAANNIASILAVIVRMSDDVKNSSSPLAAQGALLAMQNAIQKNAARIRPHVQVVIDAVDAERAVQTTEDPRDAKIAQLTELVLRFDREIGDISAAYSDEYTALIAAVKAGAV